MNIKAIATVVAVTALTTLFTPASFAQSNDLPAGIEVITITAPRLMPIMASACVNTVITTARAKAAIQQELGNNDRSGDRSQVRQAIRSCMTQAAAGEAQI